MSILDISYIYISKYLLQHNIYFGHISIVYLQFKSFISNYWYLKVIFWDQKIYFEITVVWDERRLWDIKSCLVQHKFIE